MKFKHLIIFAMIPFIAACGNGKKAAQDTWKTIPPEEVKNAVTLFDKDWMLLSAGKEGDFNTMTISWGEMGELWGKPVVTVFVHESRYTKEFMDRSEYFTVAAFPEEYRGSLSYLGSHSGRDGDKVADAGLHPEFTALGNPGFEEANLLIECKIIYREPFNMGAMNEEFVKMYNSRAFGGKVHTQYIGEIVNVYSK